MSTGTTRQLSKTALYDQLIWKPHQAQSSVIHSPARNRVVSAGRRFGKSQIGGHELIPEAFLTSGMLNVLQDIGQRREFWIVGPEYSDAEKEFRIFWDECVRLGFPFDRPGSYNNALSGSMHISMFNGKFQVHGKSAKYPETLVGEGLSGVIMAEAAKLKQRVWTKFIRPTLSDFNGWSLFSSTPEGKNWFYDLWRAGQDPSNPDWASWRMPSWFNPYVFPLGEKDPEIEAMRRDMSAEMFSQEVAALFTEFVGRVFKEFDEEEHVGDLAYNPAWETYACVDYGFTNPFVWLLIQVGPWDEIHILNEIYEPGLTIDEAAPLIKDRGMAPSGLRKFYPDPASPGDTRILQKMLKVPSAGGTGGELKDRLEMIKRWLKHPGIDGGPRLRIDRKCVNTIREFNDYRYPKTAAEAAEKNMNAPEKPLKKDDHAPEALGRFFAGHYGTPARLMAAGARVRHSSLSR